MAFLRMSIASAFSVWIWALLDLALKPASPPPLHYVELAFFGFGAIWAHRTIWRTA